MADLSFEEHKALQELKHGMDCRRDLMNAATGYALKGLNAVFLLNGAAATAILTGMHYEVPFDVEKNQYDASMLCFSLGRDGEDFHIVPVIAGAGGGRGKAVIGAVIMVAAVVGAMMVPGFQLAAGLAGPTLSFGAAMGSTCISFLYIPFGIFCFQKNLEEQCPKSHRWRNCVGNTRM